MVGVSYGPGNSSAWPHSKAKERGKQTRGGEAQYRTVDLMLDTVYGELMEQARGSALDGWKFVREKHGVKISRRAGGGGNAGLKGVGVIDARPEEVFEVLWDIEKRSRWDRMVETSRLVRQINDQCMLVYITLAGKLAVSPRDLCVLYAYKRLASGAFVVLIRSIVHDEVPVVSGFVRAELLTSGFLVEPHNGLEGVGTLTSSQSVSDVQEREGKSQLSATVGAPGGGQRNGTKRHRRALSDVGSPGAVKGSTASLVTYVVQLDFKGWLPAMISNMMTMYQPLRISTLRACVECNVRVKKRIEEEEQSGENISSSSMASSSSSSALLSSSSSSSPRSSSSSAFSSSSLSALKGFVGLHEFERTYRSTPSPSQRENLSLFLNRTSTPALLHALPSKSRLHFSTEEEDDDDSYPRIASPSSPPSQDYSSDSGGEDCHYLDAEDIDGGVEEESSRSDDEEEEFLETTSDMTELFASPLRSIGNGGPYRKSLRSSSLLLSPGGVYHPSLGAMSTGGGGMGGRGEVTEVGKRNEELRACLFVLQHELEQVSDLEANVASKLGRLQQQLEQETKRRRAWEQEQEIGTAKAERKVQELLTRYLTRVGAIGEEQKSVDTEFSRSHASLLERLSLLTHFHDALTGRHASQARYRVYWGCLVFVVLSALATAWAYRATGPFAALLRRAFAAVTSILRKPRAVVALADRRIAALRAYASSMDDRLND